MESSKLLLQINRSGKIIFWIEIIINPFEMKLNLPTFLFMLFIFSTCKNESKTPLTTHPLDQEEQWIELFNGKDFTGWKPATEHDSTWSITDGVMQASGKRCHLFYVGDQLKDGFKNFELIATVKTHKLANSGIYFHTQYQAEGWPSRGFEIQVNNSHIGEGDYREYKKTGSLYSIRNIYQTFVPDSVWYETRALVEGRHVQIWINGMQTVDYIEPEDPLSHGLDSAHILSKGTFALQGHDVLSKTQYKSIKVRRIPDEAGRNIGPGPSLLPWYDSMKVLSGKQFAFIDLNPHSMIPVDSLLRDYYNFGVNVSVVNEPEHAGELSVLNMKPLFKGIRVDINTLKEMKTGWKQDFTIGESKTIPEAMTILKSGKINVWSHQGEGLTAKNSGPLLDLAAKSRIAVEIDNSAGSPSIEVIALAKSKGCKFTFANLVPVSKLEKSVYILDAIKGAGLDYKDQWIPKL